MPNGDVIPCSFKPQVIGNLRKSSFSEIWFSENAIQRRKEIKNCKGCWVICDIIPSIIYSGDIIAWLLKRQIKSLFFHNAR
jgi:MoaA/NifB/PqqE/SkfB family radical SAM enzyme